MKQLDVPILPKGIGDSSERAGRGASLCRLLLPLIALCFCAGCATLPTTPRSKAPRIHVATPSGTVLSQSGNAQSAPVVATSQGSVEIPIPAKSEVVITPATATSPEKISITVPTPTILRSVSTSEHIEGARGHQPPTPTEIARGDAVRWAFVAGGVFLLFGLALVYFQHYKAAGFAFAGSFLVPAVARFLASDKALWIGVVIAAISATLVAAWYLVTTKFDLFPKAKR